MKDALGNDLIVGKWYAYSNNNNGITTIKAGRLKSVSIKRAIVDVMYFATAMYDDDPVPRPEPRKRIPVKGNMLVPILKSKMHMNYEKENG